MSRPLFSASWCGWYMALALILCRPSGIYWVMWYLLRWLSLLPRTLPGTHLGWVSPAVAWQLLTPLFPCYLSSLDELRLCFTYVQNSTKHKRRPWLVVVNELTLPVPDVTWYVFDSCPGIQPGVSPALRSSCAAMKFSLEWGDSRCFPREECWGTYEEIHVQWKWSYD